MQARSVLALLAAAALVVGCSGGSGGPQGAFQLVEFLESGKDSIPRNRSLTFQFSAPVASAQDFAERLKIQNVQTSPTGSNFALAIGTYVVLGDQVQFTPRLPERPDRTDAGLRSDGSYVVFVKAGPDSLASTGGDRIAFQQEFIFDTSPFFEDPLPSDPPRALSLTAIDPVAQTTQDLGRLDSNPSTLAGFDSDTLITSGLVLEPGAGGAPNFSTSWQFDMAVSEPIDPATVNTDNIRLLEIRSDALTTATTADPGHFGTAVNFRVPISVETIQRPNATTNVLEFIIRVRPTQTLVDDARYRLEFSGAILGIDFRKTFIGDNGLTGAEIGPGGGFTEPGGLGYVTEFVVFDRPAIAATRTLTYDPLVDGILPETGQSSANEDEFNSALYNPVTDPGAAVGFLSAFGNGSDGNFAVAGGNIVTLDTGDTRNADLGNPFTVNDLNPNDDFLSDTRPGGPITYDSPEAFELQLESLTVSSSSTLRIIGVNPCVLRVAGICQINGTIDLSGDDGLDSGTGVAAGGVGGAGGFAGGTSLGGDVTCSTRPGSCSNFSVYLNGCGGAIQANFPYTSSGEGPGRGMAGGEAVAQYSTDESNTYGSTGGGGASHARVGSAGEDRRNASVTPGLAGNCGTWNTRPSSVVGVRGMPGPTYGDREIVDVTLGGAGGGAGGTMHARRGSPATPAGGGGGGGGGSFTLISSGTILANGGVFDVSGGDGGNGSAIDLSTSTSFSWVHPAGGGGGGAGGSLALISGDNIELSGGIITAAGGNGGPRGVKSSPGNCNACNAGGAGGDGFLFLMDADGEISGLIPGSPGDYDGFANGVLTIRAFDTTRFSDISAVTELFPMTAADPQYVALAESDVLGNVSSGQRIRIFVSSAVSDTKDPLAPDITTETASFEVALVSFVAGGSAVTVTGDMTNLNPPGNTRDAFVRVRAVFEYDSPVEAALGPFAAIDELTISYTFNG